MKSIQQSASPVQRRQQRRGSALIITLLVLAVLGAAVAAVSVSVSTSANVSMQAASWQEAIMAAEAGADIAMASFKVALDESQYWNDSAINALSDVKTGATAWSGWLDTSTGLAPATNAKPTKLSYTKVLRPAGSGNTALQSTVWIEKLSTSDTNGVWYRVRSTGLAGVSGTPRVGADKRDNDLRKLSLQRSPGALSGFPSATLGSGVAQVARSVEVLVKPIAKSQGLWDRAITVGTTVDINSTMTMDSFDSNDPNKSYFAPGATYGVYDPSKLHLAPNYYGNNCDIASNDIGSHVKLNHSYLWGDLTYNTGTATGTDHVQGTITNNYFDNITGISAPSWQNNEITNTPAAITKVSYTLTGGSATSPAKYKLSDLTLQSGNVLTFQTPPGNGNADKKYIEIWCTKDLNLTQTAQIVIPDGFYVTFYIAGKLSMSGGAFTNNRASQLTVYGIDTGNSTTPQWSYGSDSDFVGTLYGNKIEFKVSGKGNFYGAVLVSSVAFGGTTAAGFHFDEALLKDSTASGNTPRFQVASWIEDVR